jgi:hypothetical protein
LIPVLELGSKNTFVKGKLEKWKKNMKIDSQINLWLDRDAAISVYL